MGKTYRRGASSYGRKVLEGSGGIRKQKSSPIIYEKSLEVKSSSKKYTLSVQDEHKGNQYLVNFIHYLNSINSKVEVLKDFNYKLWWSSAKYRFKIPTNFLQYKGDIDLDWFDIGFYDESISYSELSNRKDILLKDDYVYCDIEYEYEEEIIEEPDIIWSGRSVGYDDWNIDGKHHKYRKEQARVESSIREWEDIQHNHIYDHCYYFSDSYTKGPLPHDFNWNYVDEMEEIGFNRYKE